MGISPTQLLIILAIVALLFGTKKLRSMGGDLGTAVKNFKTEMNQNAHKPEASLTHSISVTDMKVDATPLQSSAQKNS